MLGQVENSVAEDVARFGFGRDEISRAGGVANILIRSISPLFVIGIKEPVRSLAIDHQAKFPTEVVHVLKTRVRSTRAKGRNLMRCVTSKEDTAMAELLHATALEGVDR